MWNDTVTDADEVWHLGDLSYKCSTRYAVEIAGRLNGKCIYLMQGNHDGNRQRAVAEAYPDRFRYYGDYHEIREAHKHMVLSHYPFECWNRAYHGSWMLHGHTHGNLGEQNWTRIDVSVTCSNWKPVSETQIETYMLAKKQERNRKSQPPKTAKRAAGIAGFEGETGEIKG
jgi:calcineurin-like phosphoesterase family protein